MGFAGDRVQYREGIRVQRTKSEPASIGDSCTGRRIIFNISVSIAEPSHLVHNMELLGHRSLGVSGFGAFSSLGSLGTSRHPRLNGLFGILNAWKMSLVYLGDIGNNVSAFS